MLCVELEIDEINNSGINCRREQTIELMACRLVGWENGFNETISTVNIQMNYTLL